MQKAGAAMLMRLTGGGVDDNPWEKQALMPNYYTELGVVPGVKELELRTAHKKMILKYHPDKNAGSKIAQDRFIRIQVVGVPCSYLPPSPVLPNLVEPML
jgi:hypothetical protein